MSDDAKYDGILMTIIQQTGNIDTFFNSVFGFLRRNTDFFANQKKAEQIIVNSCKVNFEKFTKDAKAKEKQELKRKEEAEQKKRLKEEKQKKQREEAIKKQQPAKIETPTEIKPVVPQNKVDSSEKKEEDNEPAPKGNGGRTEKYIWSQTLENIELFIFLPENITKKNLKVSYDIDNVKIIVNGTTLIDGKWKEKINSQETYWTIQDGLLENYIGKYLHINAEKWKNQTSWWSTPIKGDLQINTQKINPQPSKLSDLDGQTRSTVEKMMFDMRQKQQGLPSSDELQKQDKLKEFMKAHPQLDFSQCKFN